jgi:four helix bundle protein
VTRGEVKMMHNDLEVWKKSIDFVTEIYKITKEFPKEEIYGLTSQIRRAAVSIPSNIAEGSGRKSDKEFIQFLYIALGSVAETETQLIIASKINYLENSENIIKETETIRRMLLGLIKHLKGKRHEK